jgi:predicted ATPase/class 3 adenylate cyclase/DNA-binding CsgD family transcriptional regulator
MHWGDVPVKMVATPEAKFSLPAGTVTFLLADVEGSSRLWEADRESAAQDLVALEAILADAVGRGGGVMPIEQGEGDSAVGAFSQASDALAAAIHLQRRVSQELPSLRIRVALHTGESQRRDEARYFGQALNRCARLRELAHGGQTLLSRATCDLVIDRLPEAVTLLDLGSHRLRDLARPEQIFQLCHPDIASEFPPLRSLEAFPNNLPVQLTSFIGREKEIQQIAELLDEARLIALTGAGGAGKTRLALQVSAQLVERFPDGIWWVDLAPLGDADLVPDAVAAVLSIREVPFQPLVETITRQLETKRLLLILDNCEHVVGTCASLVRDLMVGCPELGVLATSREPLGVEGEATFRVPSLALPDRTHPPAIEALTQCEAVRLFVDRAVRARPNFRVTNANAPAVAEICHRLDGIPLAIELAAARARVLAPERISEGLSDIFRLLTGGKRTALPRQQTLRASVDWSINLLSDTERTMLRRLSVFTGGFTLDAAEAVSGGDGIDPYQVLDLLTSLVDKSLVQVGDAAGDTRFRLLETIRQYSLERLAEAGEAEAIRTRHLGFFTVMAERAEQDTAGAGFMWFIDRVGADQENVRAAVDWSLASGRYEDGLKIAYGLGFLFWYTRGLLTEGRARCEALLAASDEMVTAGARARVEAAAAALALGQFDLASAAPLAERALSDAEAAGDAVAASLALVDLGQCRFYTGHLEEARPLLERALEAARAAGHLAMSALALVYIGQAEAFEGNVARARPLQAEAVEIARRSGQPFVLAMALTSLSSTPRGDFLRSEEMSTEAIEVLEGLQENIWRPGALAIRAWARLYRGDEHGAETDLERAFSISRENMNVLALSVSLVVRGFKEWAWADPAAAEKSLEEATNLCRAINLRHMLVMGFAVAAMVAGDGGDVGKAESFLAEAEEVLGVSEAVWWRSWIVRARAAAATAQRRPDRAEEFLHEAIRLQLEGEDVTGLIDSLEALAIIAADQESYIEATRLLAAADAARRETGYRRFPVLAPPYERTLKEARGALGTEEFERAWAEGAALSVDDAVAYARRGRGERKRPSTGWTSLTPVERQVADLVAARLTNPQIAERMFVSRATVKSHLSHIYSKLEIASRMELADAVARHRVEA